MTLTACHHFSGRSEPKCDQAFMVLRDDRRLDPDNVGLRLKVFLNVSLLILGSGASPFTTDV
jgi:hypothetical protein